MPKIQSQSLPESRPNHIYWLRSHRQCHTKGTVHRNPEEACRELSAAWAQIWTPPPTPPNRSNHQGRVKATSPPPQAFPEYIQLGTWRRQVLYRSFPTGRETDLNISIKREKRERERRKELQDKMSDRREQRGAGRRARERAKTRDPPASSSRLHRCVRRHPASHTRA